MGSRIEAGSRRLRFKPHPHQHELGEILDEGVTTTAVQWPRRSGKTWSVWGWMLGRCELEDDTNVVVTAQTQKAARKRFMDVKRVLDRSWPESDGGPKIRYGNGAEAIEWENGSMLWVAAPTGSSVRGEAADVFYGDEPQEWEIETSSDLQQAVPPLFDTRPNGQIILSGTPGVLREGWYWTALQAAAEGKPGFRSSVHAAKRGENWEDEDVWRRVHPGIGTLTTIEIIRERRAGYDNLTQFAMEYLGIWPGTDSNRALNAEKWDAGGLDIFVAKPDRFALAYDVEIDGSAAALVAAWRDADGVAYVELLTHGSPRDVGVEALRLHRAHRVPINYDSIGANLKVAEGLERARPKPRVSPFDIKSMYVGASTLVDALEDGKLRHFKQPGLDQAAEAAAWRNVEGGQLFARRASKGAVAPIVAASIALLAFDRVPERRSKKSFFQATAA